MSRRYSLDVVERTFATYVVTLLGLLLAAGFDFTDMGAVKAAGLASIPAALTVIKAAIATAIGDPGTAALLPAAKPTPPTAD